MVNQTYMYGYEGKSSGYLQRTGTITLKNSDVLIKLVYYNGNGNITYLPESEDILIWNIFSANYKTPQDNSGDKVGASEPAGNYFAVTDYVVEDDGKLAM